ncbi:GT-D fold domain-containing glycosyltransferase [Paenibacillus sp. J2TS4]|uniref:GT-D fold domain-containing protein n=1 Tax=Paenibacillus sp. J2TS4 TaxID=2807194 RepID=UPI001AFEF5FE|nr:GT-D fold domain-containing glycosyltransferase [Paenibacillus sp. J2TS4]GIP31275.1 hypothetical protein J2TS4_04850 [Paenibacillus sp. J2TS4]
MLRLKRKKKRITPKKNCSKVFNTGFNQGYDKGHDEGYQRGKYDGEYKWRDGVEGIVDSLLPDGVILPEISAEQIIAAGLEPLRPHFHHLLTAQQVGDEILHSLETRIPMSVVRLGDGELLTLAQGVVLSIEQVKSEGAFLQYAGVNVPDYAARDELADSVRQATIVGIPKLRVRNFQPLSFPVLRAHGIDYQQLSLTDSLINYSLYQSGYLSKMVSGRNVLIIGNLAVSLADYLRRYGVNVVDAIAPVHGVKDIPRVMDEVFHCVFDIALVASGIASVIIAQRIADGLGKVAIDLGHLADSMLKGEAPYK